MSPTPQRELRSVVETLERLAGETTSDRHAHALLEHAAALAGLADAVTPVFRPDMLTPAQSSVLAFIRSHIAIRGRPPTRKEIAKAFGYASDNAAQEHVRALERKGHITLTGGARGIRVNIRAAADITT